MTKAPTTLLTTQDIPAPVAGAAKYWPSPRRITDGRVDVEMLPNPNGGRWSFVETCRDEQSAIRCAIRWQKRENAAVTKARKAGGR